MADMFSTVGRNAIPIRIIIGAMIIQTKLGLTDRETIDIISSTPRFQYFLGLDTFDPCYEFDFTLLCKYRQKIGIDTHKEMIDLLLTKHKVISKVETTKSNEGTISIDATCVPVNITYPTDLKLLNAVRIETEEIIDELTEEFKSEVKPRTYRKMARKDYLEYAKKKQMSREARFTGNRKQLQYIKRNLDTINNSDIYVLNEEQKEKLKIITKIYEQQYQMWESKTTTVEDRVVNLYQPHIRGIVRGKTGAKVEFGPKIAVSKINGFIYLDELSFSNFNESLTLEAIVEDYYFRFGVYPENVNADKIYQTKRNKEYCKSRGIRLSGKQLGSKKEVSKEEKEVILKDFKKRQEIEGVFGVAKVKYGLSKLLTRLPDSQKASIGMVFFVMNLMQLLRYVSFCSKIEVVIFSIIVNETCYVYDTGDVYY
jgi:hypothetical protein